MELFCIDRNTNNSFCAGKAAQAITRHCLKSNQRRSRSFLGFLELGAAADALQKGRVWQELAAGCLAPGT